MTLELIEPFPEWAWPLAWEWMQSSRSMTTDDFSPKTLDAFVVEYSTRANLDRIFGVRRDGLLIGMLRFERLNPAASIVHVLASRQAAGCTVEAGRLAYDRIFADEPQLMKVLGLIPKYNRLALALARRSGFQEEGVLRWQTVKNGKPVDVVAMGLTREDHEHGRGAERRVLRGQLGEPGNPEAHLHQRAAGDSGCPVPGLQRSGAEPGNGRLVAERPEHGDGECGPDQQDVCEHR